MLGRSEHALLCSKRTRLAERMNRTIMERVRSMLAHAKLPKTFWAEALSTTTYVINRSPLVALARAMLEEKSLPKFYWAEAVRTAVYI